MTSSVRLAVQSRSFAQSKSIAMPLASSYESCQPCRPTTRATATNASICGIALTSETTFVLSLICWDKVCLISSRGMALCLSPAARFSNLLASCLQVLPVGPSSKFYCLKIQTDFISPPRPQPHPHRPQTRKHPTREQRLPDIHIQPYYSLFLPCHKSQRTAAPRSSRQRN